MYLVINRLDICYVVSTLSQFMSQWIPTHWIVVKHVLRYLQGTIGHGMRYTSNIDMLFVGYVLYSFHVCVWARHI
jgi:hypothetical protein